MSLQLPLSRLVGVGLIVAWLATLALPAYRSYIEYFGGPASSATAVSVTYGLECALWGWLGPLVLQPATFGHPLPPGESTSLYIAVFGEHSLAGFAWFANVFWMLNTIRLLRGKPLLLWMALLSTAIGSTALQPFYRNAFDDHGVETASTPVIGAYIWAALMAAPLLLALWQKWSGRTNRPNQVDVSPS